MLMQVSKTLVLQFVLAQAALVRGKRADEDKPNPPPPCDPSPVELIPYRPYLNATFTLFIDGPSDDDVVLETNVLGNYNDAKCNPDCNFASFFWVNKTSNDAENNLVFIGDNFGLDFDTQAPLKPCTDTYYPTEFTIDKDIYRTWSEEGKVSIYTTFSPTINDICDTGNKVSVQFKENEGSLKELYAPTSKRVIFDFQHRAKARSKDEIFVNTYVRGGYLSEEAFATFYLVDDGDDEQTVNISSSYELGTNSGGNENCANEYYEEKFAVPPNVYNDYSFKPGRNLRVLMVQVT